MAKAIEPTPELSGEDAKAVLRELEARVDPARVEADVRAGRLFRASRNGRPVTIEVRDAGSRR